MKKDKLFGVSFGLFLLLALSLVAAVFLLLRTWYS